MEKKINEREPLAGAKWILLVVEVVALRCVPSGKEKCSPVVNVGLHLENSENLQHAKRWTGTWVSWAGDGEEGGSNFFPLGTPVASASKT